MVGLLEGMAVGILVGAVEGLCVGVSDGLAVVGDKEGDEEGTEEGSFVGDTVGFAVVGFNVGFVVVGNWVGMDVGATQYWQNVAQFAFKVSAPNDTESMLALSRSITTLQHWDPSHVPAITALESASYTNLA